MGKIKQNRVIWACDFETYVPKAGEDFTYVWSAAFTALYEEGDNVRILESIDEFMGIFLSDDSGNINELYFHNLKFDGSFIVDWLLKNGYSYSSESVLNENEFNTIISDMGSWYSISIMSKTNYIIIKDSLKLFPFSLAEIAKSFELTHQKTSMNYFNKISLKDCNESDIEYIKEDVLVLREALEGILTSGLHGLTIGSMCLSDYKKRITKKFGRSAFNDFFPNLDGLLPIGISEDEYVRKSYRGGVCYAYRTGKFTQGVTYDKVSMYPGVMLKYKLPYGMGIFTSNYIPFDEMYSDDKTLAFGKVSNWNAFNLDWDFIHNQDYFWFVHIECNFELKPNHLPTIQIKNNPLYWSNDYLTTSKVEIGGKKYDKYIKDGKVVPTKVELFLSMYDFELLLKHYDVTNLRIIDSIYYKARDDMFSVYIKYWAKIKKTSTGALRAFAKLMLNNLYGKLSTNPVRASKIPYLKDEHLAYMINESVTDSVHIACGAAITACARYELLTTAQLNERFVCYMDTDSIHMVKPIKRMKLITTLAKIGKEIGDWDKESDWDEAYFIRAKTYTEHIEANEKVDKPYWTVRGCGCPQRSKNLFLECVDGVERVFDKSLIETTWVNENKHKLKMANFTYGLSVPGKLTPKIVKGGTVLQESFFTINENNH